MTQITTSTSGIPFCWAQSSQYSNTITGIDRTHDISLANLAANAARQGTKADLGLKRPGGYAVKVGARMVATPTAGGPIEYYWSSSPSATAALANTGGVSVSGMDIPWGPGGAAEADIDEWKQQLSFVGVLPVAADGELDQVKVINSYFVPPERYGQFIVKNDASTAFSASVSGVYIAMIPVTDDIQ